MVNRFNMPGIMTGLAMPLVLSTVLILQTGCKPPGAGKKSDKDKNENSVPVLVSVGVSEVGLGSIEQVVKASTDLEAEVNVSVFARTANFVAEILVEEGDVLKQGDLMVRLVDDIQKTQLEKAKVSEERARIEFQRQERLYNDKIISDAEFKNVELDYRQQKLLLEEAQRELDFTLIKSPIDGTVTTRMINLGDNVNVNQQLFDLVDFRSIKAPVYLPESELRNLKPGLEARVYAPALGDDPFSGVVERVSPVVDARSGTVEVLIGFDGATTDKLRPGMYVNVEVVTATRESAVLVPREALVYDADQVFVFRLVPGREFPDRTIERVLVKPILEDREFIEPSDGIDVGDRLVVIGKAGLRPDSLVRLEGDPKEYPKPAQASGSDSKNKPAESAAGSSNENMSSDE